MGKYGFKEGKWIWHKGEDKPENAYVHFRKSFLLERIPDEASVSISADCKYLLIINGRTVGRGPVTTAPEYKQVDTYNVQGHLSPGENVIAVTVLHRQNKTSRLIPARGGLILEFNSSPLLFGTDTSWKARLADEYKSDAPYMTHQYGQQEWCDGRKVPAGWESPGFDDSTWEDALLVDNPREYWPEELEIREVPYMLFETRHPVKLVSCFGLSSLGRPAEDDYEPAKQIMYAYPLSSIAAWQTDNIAHPQNGPAIFMENQGDGVGIVVDMGEEMLGYPFIDIECEAGVTVNIGHGEILSRNRIQTVLMPEARAEQLYAERYITRNGRQRFEIFDTKGCRYLEIHFNRLADFYTGAKVIIHEVGMIQSTAPIKNISRFSCPDETLNRIWDICRRTATVKCQDWQISDAQREQNNWVEIFQEMLYFQCFGRVAMLRQTINQFARAQLREGFILSTFPVIQNKKSEEITPDDLYIFSTMGLPILVYLDWLYGGEDERQPYWLDCCTKAINALLKYKNDEGIITNLPGHNWVEWTGIDARDKRTGAKDSWQVAFWNAFIVLMLEKISEMAAYLGKKAEAESWIKTADEIRGAADKLFWSEKKGAYIDGIYDGMLSSYVSMTTNAMAVLARLGTQERMRTVLENLQKPGFCDIESGINMMAIYHEALQSTHMDDNVIERIKQKWGYMLQHGATTTWEAEEALERNLGLCFGFAGHPLNYISRTILGITPVEPGYRKFSVRIDTKGLECAEGEIATPQGMIGVKWSDTKNKFTLNLDIPQGCKALAGIPVTGDSLLFREVLVDGEKREPSQEMLAICTFLRDRGDSWEILEGSHRVEFIK